jgi:hypothetical protein
MRGRVQPAPRTTPRPAPGVGEARAAAAGALKIAAPCCPSCSVLKGDGGLASLEGESEELILAAGKKPVSAADLTAEYGWAPFNGADGQASRRAAPPQRRPAAAAPAAGRHAHLRPRRLTLPPAPRAACRAAWASRTLPSWARTRWACSSPATWATALTCASSSQWVSGSGLRGGGGQAGRGGAAASCGRR